MPTLRKEKISNKKKKTLTLYFKELVGEGSGGENKLPKISRREEIVKSRVEINEIETRKQ